MRKLILLLIVALFQSALSAVDGTWTNGGGDDNWNTAGNWSTNPAIPNGAADTALFPANSPVYVDTNVVLDVLTASNGAGEFVVYGQAGYTLTANTLAQTGAAGTLHLNDNFSNNDFFRFGSDPGYINISNGSTIIISENIIAEANKADVNLQGPGTLRMANSTFGSVDIAVTNSGTLRYTNVTATANSISLGNGSTLELEGGSLAASVSGAGGLSITQSAAVTGSNSYEGGTTIDEAVSLFGNTSSVPSAGGVTIGNNGTLSFNQSTSGTYSGVISGAGGKFIKAGTGTVTLSNTNLYTGTTAITGGALSVTGAINANSTTTVNGGTTLTGSGSVGPVNNSGTVTVGLAATDTFTINGAFSQAAAGATVKTRVTTASASLLSITGAATLQGTLELILAPGVYPEGTSFTVLDAAGGLGGTTFDSITDNDAARVWQLAYVGNTVTITATIPSAVPPVPLNTLPQDPRTVGNYFFGSDGVSTASTDLTLVANASVAISDAEGFAESLLRLSPITQDGILSTTRQNDFQMAIAIDKQFQNTSSKRRRAKKRRAHARGKSDETLCYGIPQTGAFVQPIGIFYHQSQTADTLAATRQVPFWAYTYGAGFGYEYVFDGQFVVEGGIGYTHSNLNWGDNFGNSRWNSVYLAPFFGWFNSKNFANVMVMGTFNFYDTKRKIQFPGIERVAKSRYNGYDLLVRLNGGTRLYLGENLWFQPDGTVNFLTIFREGYHEHGAGGVSLQVRHQTSYILQPSFRARLINEVTTHKFCYAPNLYVGWLANVPVGSSNTTSRFVEAPTNLFFTIEGDQMTRNQLVLGAEFFAQRFDKFEITSNFEADILSKFEIYTVKLKFEWFF